MINHEICYYYNDCIVLLDSVICCLSGQSELLYVFSMSWWENERRRRNDGQVELIRKLQLYENESI